MLLKNLGKTNCLTHIPEDIKLELNDGKLTLKAGSKVYVPNGFEADGTTPKFDEIVIDKDYSRDTGGGTSSQALCVWDNNAKGIRLRNLSYVYSGETAPSSLVRVTWYDTKNNIIKFYNADGVQEGEYGAFPLSLVYSDSSNKLSSIDQVFNGFGYIGSTEFALPGVKGLIPDGWDEGGRYKTKEVTLSDVWTYTNSGTASGDPYWFVGSTFDTYNPYYIQSSQPTTKGMWYDTKNNLIKRSTDGGVTWEKRDEFFVGTISIVSGKIASLNINPIQTKHDYKNYILTRKNRKYYKYVDWTQPILSSNGTMGGDGFACSESGFHTESDGREQRAWRMFSDGDYNGGDEWQINNVSTSSTYSAAWYNPKPLKISALQVQNGSGALSVTKLVLQACNDKVSWVDLGTTNNGSTTTSEWWNATIDKTGWYKYYRIVVTPRSTTALMVAKLKITAQERVESNKNDYDFYEDEEPKRYLFARNGKFY